MKKILSLIQFSYSYKIIICYLHNVKFVEFFNSLRISLFATATSCVKSWVESISQEGGAYPGRNVKNSTKNGFSIICQGIPHMTKALHTPDQFHDFFLERALNFHENQLFLFDFVQLSH